jgi:hypothetical protein
VDGNGAPRVDLSGAVDLAAVAAAAERRAEQERALLVKLGSICSCGERIRDQGVRAWIWVDTPRGRDLHGACFHSRECARFQANAHRVVLTQDCPAFQWADESAHGD